MEGAGERRVGKGSLHVEALFLLSFIIKRYFGIKLQFTVLLQSSFRLPLK